MYTLKKLNVVRVVESEASKLNLTSQGFKLIEEVKKIAEDVQEVTVAVEEKVTKGKTK